MSDFVSQLVDKYPELKYALLDAQTFSQEHYGFPAIYYKMMETDAVRVEAFKETFKQYNNLQDAVVCEAGIGTLALTKHYLPFVKKAYLIENNPNIRSFIEEEIEKNGWTDKVELIFGDAMKVELPEKVDYIIGELMSIYCANEYQVQIFKHLRQFLKPEGKLIPEKIINTAALADAKFDGSHKHYPLMFTRHMPMFLTLHETVNVIDLYKEEALTINAETRFQPILSGPANCVYMSSLVQVKEGVNFTGTDSLMPPTVCKLTSPKVLKAGEGVLLKSSFGYGTSLDDAKFEIGDMAKWD